MPNTANGAVRAALAADRAHVARTLAAAFQNDPVLRFIFPDGDDRRAHLPRLFALLYDSDGARGARFMTVGGEAATLWRAPGAGPMSWREKVAEGLPWLRATGTALFRAMAYGDASDANHPAEPHWYLHVAGCDPAAQGSGHGRAAIRAGLDRADRDCVPAYLETATERNVGYYQSLGFVVTHSWRVRGSLTNWSMLRPATPPRLPGSPVSSSP